MAHESNKLMMFYNCVTQFRASSRKTRPTRCATPAAAGGPYCRLGTRGGTAGTNAGRPAARAPMPLASSYFQRMLCCLPILFCGLLAYRQPPRNATCRCALPQTGSAARATSSGTRRPLRFWGLAPASVRSFCGPARGYPCRRTVRPSCRRRWRFGGRGPR